MYIAAVVHICILIYLYLECHNYRYNKSGLSVFLLCYAPALIKLRMLTIMLVRFTFYIVATGTKIYFIRVCIIIFLSMMTVLLEYIDLYSCWDNWWALK